MMTKRMNRNSKLFIIPHNLHSLQEIFINYDYLTFKK